jgi:pyruvate kinase
VARRAKVVCTLGPASNTVEGVQALVDGGMDVARLNFSPGTHDSHAELHSHVRRAGDIAGKAVGVLADLQGPKIRLGTFAAGPVELAAGDTFVLTTDPVPGTAQRAYTTYTQLPDDVGRGDMILVNDGLVRLEVEKVDDREVTTRVVEGGTISDHKGINLPGVKVSSPALTQKDADALRFALRLGVDMVALSFVRSPADIAPVHAVMDDAGRRVPVIAKIEKPEAVERLDAIVDAFDGLMIARGDLGVELPLQEVPIIQKRAIQLAREHAKPVIVATQMLESMIVHSRPTRAEVSDIANAVLDGADALMLSGETSAGRWPRETVRTMVQVIAAAEGDRVDTLTPLPRPVGDRDAAIAAAAVAIGRDVLGRALVAFTTTGTTARRLAAHRPGLPLLAFTPDPAVRSQLALSWGVETFVMPPVANTDDMVREVDNAMLELHRGQPGDPVVIVAGTPPGRPGNTNTIRVHPLARA